MDAFYASVELRRRPELRGKPVVVCGSGPRAVVTTASYEARRLAGIHSAMPAAVARRRLPDAVYLTPDFPAYREASAQVMEVLRRNVETVEVVGLDEAYLDLTGIFSPKATMRRIAAEIRERDRADLLDRDLREPDAGQDHQRAGQAGRPGRALARGGAGALRRRVARPGAGDRPEDGDQAGGDGDPHASPTCASASARSSKPPSARAPAPGCTPAAGSGTRRRSRSRARPSRSRWRRPSTSTCASGASWSRHLAEQAAELCRRLRKRELEGRTIGIKVRLDDWTNVTRSHTVEEPTNDPDVVGPVALDLLRAYDPQRPVRLLGVRVASFERRGGGRPSAEPADERTARSLGLAG